MDLDVDIGNGIFQKELPALERHDDAIMARKRCGHHPDARVTGAKDCLAIPIRTTSVLVLHRVQKGKELGSHVVFPDLIERVVADNAELLRFQVCF